MTTQRLRLIPPAPGFLDSLTLHNGELCSLLLVGALALILFVSFIDLRIGVFLAEAGFPIMALVILLSQKTDRFAPGVLFPAVYLFWYWLGNFPLLRDDQVAVVSGSANGRVWFYCTLGLFGYLCGTLMIRETVSNPSAMRRVTADWQPRPTLIVLAGLSVIAFLAWISIVLREGIPVLNSVVDTYRVEVQSRNHMGLQILLGAASLLFPLICLYMWTSPSPRFKRSLYAANIFIVVIFVSLGSRGLILPSILTVFALRHYLRKPWPVRYIVGIGLVLLPLLSLAGYYRSLQRFGPTYAFDLMEMGIPLQLQPFTNVYLYIRAPVETFREVLNVIPTVTPLQHGNISFGFVMQLLPGRHPSSDFFFKDILGHPNDGLGEPASILGSFFADFGGAGILIGMFLTGMLAKALYLRMYRGSLGWMLAYCFLWQKLIGSLYGSLFTYVLEILVPITWVFLVWVLTRGTVIRRDASSLELETP